MADVVKEIEITAALSADYQNAFKAATSIASSSAKELAGLTKREADLQKLLELSSKQAEAAANGNSKAAEKLTSDYDRLAEKLGLVDKTAEGVQKELAAVGARKKDVEALNKSAKKSAEFGRLAREIQTYTKAAKVTKDPALIKHLEQMKQKFKQMGGVIPSEKKLGFFSKLKSSLASLPGPIGNVAGRLGGLGSVMSSPIAVAGLAAAGIAAVGVAAVAAAKKVWDLGTSTIRTADELAKTSKQLGIDAEAYQEFAWAVGLGGASEQDLSSGLQTLNKQMEAAANGNSKAQKAFKSLGITMDEVKSMNTEEMFVRLSDALSQVDDVSAKTQTTLALFGGSGVKIAEAIKGGSAALEEMRKEARDSGYVIAREDLERAEEAADNFDRAQMQLKGVMNEIGIEVMPVINETLTDFVQLIRENRKDIKEFVGVVGKGFKLVTGILPYWVKYITTAVKVIQGAYDFWVQKFSEFFAWADDTAGTIHAWFAGIGTEITDTYNSVVTWVSSAVDTVKSAFSDLWDWAGRTVDSIVEWFTSIPESVSNVFSSVIDSISQWWMDINNTAQRWINDIIDSLVDTVMSKVSWLSDALKTVPIIGSLLEDEGGAGLVGGGNVTISVQNSIDARGATPGAGAEIARAVKSSGGQTGASVAAALDEYRGLSYAG